MCVRGQWIQKNLDVAEVNQRRWFEERWRWLENVDRTHLELISGKPVQQKMYGNTKIVASDTVSYPPRFNIHSKNENIDPSTLSSSAEKNSTGL